MITSNIKTEINHDKLRATEIETILECIGSTMTQSISKLYDIIDKTRKHIFASIKANRLSCSLKFLNQILTWMIMVFVTDYVVQIKRLPVWEYNL